MSPPRPADVRVALEIVHETVRALYRACGRDPDRSRAVALLTDAVRCAAVELGAHPRAVRVERGTGPDGKDRAVPT